MPERRSVDYILDPVRIEGRFTVSKTELEGYVVDIYQLHVKRIERL